MNAKKCDRCGKLYELYDGIKFQPTSNSYYIVRFENALIGRDFDMCPDCMKKIIEFMKAGKEGGEE